MPDASKWCCSVDVLAHKETAEVSDGGISGDMAVSHLLRLLYLTLSFSLKCPPSSSLLLTLCKAVEVFGRWPCMFITHQAYIVCVFVVQNQPVQFFPLS